MRDRWTVVVVASALVAVVATGLGLRAWADRAPADVGTSVSAAASGPSTSTTPVPSAAPSPSRPPAPQVGRSPATPPPLAARALPVEVSLPRLGVTAAVDPVGAEADGSMTIPRDPGRVGWYRFGPAPGSGSGSTVLAGHVDTAAGGPGAFLPLTSAEVGDEVGVALDDGTRRVYRVVGRETLVKTELPLDAIFDRDGPERLTLITCGGPFQPELRSYRDNVVVTAEPVG